MFTLFGMPGKVDTPEMWDSIGRYGLGTKRTLEQYQEFIGVNLTTLEVGVFFYAFFFFFLDVYCVYMYEVYNTCISCMYGVLYVVEV